ncbi:MAG: arginine--tRNA ligase [Acetobacteraceae bacterium]|nr:arginine--tRNA ligase [Acetobacteraceae bacterium]
MPENIFARVHGAVVHALRRTVPDLPEEVAARVEVSPARDPAHGDMATNAAMVSARAARQAPAKLAQALAAALDDGPDVLRAEAAGPGFVNLTLRTDALRATVPAILREDEAFGASEVGAGKPVNVEYVSANPTGPMHIGHCRGAVVGDALANLMRKAGFAVTKEYYINDAGAQVAALAWAAYWRYLQALGTTLSEDAFAAATPSGLQYKGEYLIPVGEALKAAHGDALAGPDTTIADPSLWFETVREYAVDAMMRSIREDLAALGVEQDVFTSERELIERGEADRVVERLRAQGLVYEGVLEPPKGKVPEDWEPREQTLFRSTLFGDDVDRPLRKSDGSNTYFTNDIANHADKMARGAELMIDIWGADHGGYIPRMKAAVRALAGNGPQRLEIVLCQIVHVLRGGEPVRMSKRAGTYVTLADLLEWVGRDAVRFTMLTRKSDAQMEFDLDAVVAQTRENPVFYVQYAHARCRSVLRLAGENLDVSHAALAEAPLDTLTADAELALIRRLASWPRTVEGAALAQEPHRIAFYLYDLAGDFHMLWNRGRDDSTLRFLQADRPAETLARVALVAATAITIRSGLQVLGVTPVEEMR